MDGDDQFLTIKDLARLMQVHPRTVRRWWRRLHVPPTIPHSAGQRWSLKAARLLFERWAKHPDPRPAPLQHNPKPYVRTD